MRSLYLSGNPAGFPFGLPVLRKKSLASAGPKTAMDAAAAGRGMIMLGLLYESISVAGRSYLPLRAIPFVGARWAVGRTLVKPRHTPDLHSELCQV